MAAPACQVLFQPARIGLLWSDGASAFEPYYLSGARAMAVTQTFGQLRERLDEFAHASQPTRASFALAEVGFELYQQLFAVDSAREIQAWLHGLGGAVESLTIAGDQAEWLPWGAVYNHTPREADFAKGGPGLQGFWGLRYPLTMGRKANPFRTARLLERPVVVVAVDPSVRDLLPAADRQRWQTFVESHQLRVMESRERFLTDLNETAADVVYFLGRGSAEGLQLGGETVSTGELRSALSGPDIAGMPLVILNQTGEAGSYRFPANSVAFPGLLASLSPLPANRAVNAGIGLLTHFLYDGNTLGAALQKLNESDPGLGLLFGTSLPAQLRVGNQPADGPETDAASLPLPPQPYHPLTALNREDAPLLYGREAEVETIALLLDEPGVRMVAVHGQNGVGKASLLRAGVIPFLENEALGYRAVSDRSSVDEAESPTLVLRAGADLVGQLAFGVTVFCARAFHYKTPTGRDIVVDLPELLKAYVGRPLTVAENSTAITAASDLGAAAAAPSEDDGSSLRLALRADPALLGRLLNGLTERLPFDLVILIEQVEELLSLTPTGWEDTTTRKCLELLRRTVEQTGRARFLVTLRTEFVGRFLHRLHADSGAAPWLRDFLVAGLTHEQLVEAILLPTARVPVGNSAEASFDQYGFQFEEGLPEQIAKEAMASSAEGESPLVLTQVVCARLAALALARPDKVIRAADLGRIGGVKGGIVRYVDTQIAARLTRPDDRRPALDLLKLLIRRHPDGTVTGDLVAEKKLAQTWRGGSPLPLALEALATDDSPLLETHFLNLASDDGAYVSLAHEALVPALARKADEEDRKRYGRSRIADVLWITVPLILLAAVLGWSLTNRWKESVIGEMQKEFRDDILDPLNARHKRSLNTIRAARFPLYAFNVQGARQALEAGDMVRFRQMMLSYRSVRIDAQKGEPDVDDDIRGFDWYYVWQLGEASRQTLHGHRGVVAAVAVSADGKRAVSASHDGTARLWNLEKGQENAILSGHAGMVNAVAFAPDGQTLATAGADGKVLLWNAAEGDKEPTRNAKPLAILTESKEPIHALVFLDNKTLAAAGADKFIRLWDVGETGKEKVKQTLSSHGGAVNALALTTDGKILASGGADQTVFLWDVGKEKPRATLKIAAGPLQALAFSRDGKTLATGAADSKLAPEHAAVTLWDVADGKEKQTLKAVAPAPFALAFAPDGGSLFLGGKDSNLYLFDAAKGTSRGVLRGHLGWVRGIAVTPDGKTVVSASQDGTLRLWDPRVTPSPEVLTGHKDAVTGVAIAPDNKLFASAGVDGTIKLWQAATGKEEKSLTAHKGAVLAITFAPKGMVLASAGADGEVKLWNVNPADKEFGKELRSFKGHVGEATCLAFAADAKVLASGGVDASVRLWDAEPASKDFGKELNLLKAHEGPVWSLVFVVEDGTLISGGADGFVRAWNPKTGAAVGAKVAAHGGGILALAPLGPEKKHFLSSGGDRQMKIWEMDSGPQPLLSARAHGGPITAVAMGANDRNTIMTGGWDGSIKLWQPSIDNYERLTLTGHVGPVRALAVSADNRLLVSGGQDGTVRLWRAAAPEQHPGEGKEKK